MRSRGPWPASTNAKGDEKRLVEFEEDCRHSSRCAGGSLPRFDRFQSRHAGGGCPKASGASGELSDVEKASVRQECANISKQYAYYLDTADYEGTPTAFAEDGVWEVLGNKMEGRAAIREYWKSRTALWQPNDGWVHLTSNQRIKVVDRDHATGVAYFSVYKFDKRADANKTLMPLVISRSMDEYVRTPEGWRLKHRQIFRVADVGN